MKKTEISRELGISRSTLYEELNRGTVNQMDTNLKTYRKYYADAGQTMYESNRKNSRKPLKIIDAFDFLQFAEKEILENKKAPDSICGRAKRECTFDVIVCTKTLYNYIDQCLLNVRNIDLPLRVKLNTKSRNSRKNRRILGESIENRPEIVDGRTEFGHWEIDTIVGTKDTSAVLLSLDERVSRKRHLVKIDARDTKSVKQGLEKIMALYPAENLKDIFKTITSDNGSEFAELSKDFLDVDIFFAHPHSSFERGTNEKQNSLVRKLFPKGKSFENVSDELVACVED